MAQEQVIPPEGLPTDGDFQMPSMDDLLKALDGMDLPEEEKQNLRDSLVIGANQKQNMFENVAGLAGQDQQSNQFQFLTLISLVLFVLLVLVYFGFKLYKALVDKERKREEKRRLKQQKKKK